MINNRYHQVFGKVPIFGMIHLAGEEPVKRALEELALFEEEGVDAAIIENYHGSVRDVGKTLEALGEREVNVIIGVNILPNEFKISIPGISQAGGEFVQIDRIAGVYEGNYGFSELNYGEYKVVKEAHPNIIVLGGVWPKYYTPVEGSDLEKDLQEGMHRAEAVVVTGAGTGMETPLDKIRKFRSIVGEHPLVVGAGLTVDNAYEQLCISNGAIVGTSLKVDDNTRNPMDRAKVKDFMAVVRKAREYQERA